MKVVLVNPPFYNLFHTEEKAGNIPVGLLSIAAGVEDLCDVKVLDFNTLGELQLPPGKIEQGVNTNYKMLGHYKDYAAIMSDPAHPIWDAMVSKILYEDPEVIGFTSTTAQFTGVCYLCKRINEKWNNGPIILGGPHASALPELALHESGADILALGEGDIAFRELILRYNEEKRIWHQVPGMAYRQGTSIISHPAKDFISDLDSLPMPARHLLNRDFYTPEAFGYISTSRGCPFGCTFCSSKVMWHRKIRYQGVERTVDEMEEIWADYGEMPFRINDDLFICNKKRLRAFNAELKKRGMEITYRCGARVDMLTEEMIDLLVEGGCTSVSIGIESASPRIRKLLSKGMPWTIDVRDRIAHVRAAGIKVIALFILGNPTETWEEMNQTRDMIRALDADRVSASLMTPYPGTPLFTEYRAQIEPFKPWWQWYHLGKLTYNLSAVETDVVEGLYAMILEESKHTVF